MLVLQRAAASVEVLHVVGPQEQHLRVVRAMPKLRELHVALPRATVRELEQVLAVPELAGLEAHCPLDSPLAGLRCRLPAAGLQWLRTAVYPLSAALALVRAHAATLRELQLLAASEQPYGCPDLAAELRTCRLRQLRRLVLLRRTLDAVPCRHTVDTCRRQKIGVYDALVESVPDVTVLCNACDDVE
ncbi:hypothetical protein ONE63_000108 [Megalurothrips usitatus]|uniref:Uncharacterized protein n=1 Tax=Megalurothrips usitatus TaxID=439358 RepID=A0AAV7Y2C0_9NEOP|nr:hypothetical protein ONE63_000108 [Megalurothrips usitatus]